MHEYIKTNINEEIWVVMEILVQKSVRCILSRIVACDIFLIRGQPYVTVCDRGEGVKFGTKKCDIFLNGPFQPKKTKLKIYCTIAGC